MSVDLSKSPEHFHVVSGRSGKRMMKTIGDMGKIHTMIGNQHYNWLRKNDLDSLRVVFMYDYSEK